MNFEQKLIWFRSGNNSLQRQDDKRRNADIIPRFSAISHCEHNN